VLTRCGLRLCPHTVAAHAGEAITLCGVLLLLLLIARAVSVLPILWLHNWMHAAKLSATDMIIIW
jgi:hypothetical protein